MQTRPFAAASAIAGGRGQVRAAIARAAHATGVDFNYLLAQAKLESSLNPTAKAATSSATGLYQFTQGTWQNMLEKHGGAIGIHGAASSEQLMALRNDPHASAMMAAHLATDNSAALQRTLGRKPNAGELYMAHFLGAEGAGKFLTALADNPQQSAAGILPRAAASNRNVFYDASGAARTVGTVMAMVQGRMAMAMGRGSGGISRGGVAGGLEDFGLNLDASMSETKLDPWENPELKAAWEDLNGSEHPVAATDNGGIAGEFAAARDQADNRSDGSGAMPAPPTAHSMADTLRSTFGLGGNNVSAAPDFVRNAYGRLQALGL